MPPLVGAADLILDPDGMSPFRVCMFTLRVYDARYYYYNEQSRHLAIRVIIMICHVDMDLCMPGRHGFM